MIQAKVSNKLAVDVSTEPPRCFSYATQHEWAQCFCPVDKCITYMVLKWLYVNLWTVFFFPFFCNPKTNTLQWTLWMVKGYSSPRVDICLILLPSTLWMERLVTILYNCSTVSCMNTLATIAIISKIKTNRVNSTGSHRTNVAPSSVRKTSQSVWPWNDNVNSIFVAVRWDHFYSYN